MEAFLARNFYPHADLSTGPVRWGHWSDIRVKEDGNPFGKLFGGHGLPDPQVLATSHVVYIYRDGRAVAHSIWKTDNFLHKTTKERYTFSQFLRMPLDWFCAPEIPATTPRTIAEHWYHHVHSWSEAAAGRRNVFFVRYEEVKSAPEAVYERILRHFFSARYMLRAFRGAHKVDPITQPLGLLPNEGKIDSWRDAFSADDDALFVSQLPNSRYLWQ